MNNIGSMKMTNVIIKIDKGLLLRCNTLNAFHSQFLAKCKKEKKEKILERVN